MIEPYDIVKIQKKVIKELEKSIRHILKSGSKIIDDGGTKKIEGTFFGIPVDDELQSLFVEGLVWKFGLSPSSDEYKRLKESGEYERIYHIAYSSFKLGLAYANILEKKKKK